MFLAEVIGTVVATKKLPVFQGVKLLLIQPKDAHGHPNGEALVAADTVQAGPGERVFFVTGREAALALDDPFNPADATITGIVDAVETADPARDGKEQKPRLHRRQKGSAGGSKKRS